ncbi:MAG TPA: OpcA/G6PD domain-containing protein, partial [Galbitalea sp.]
GVIDLERTIPNIATLKQPNQPTHDISLPRRSLRDCLAEELRRLDPDDLFGEVIKHGVIELEKHGKGSGREPLKAAHKAETK